MKNTILGMMLLFIALSTQAQEKKSRNAKYEFDINGNCEMCKKRIEKAALLVSGVKMASWNVETHGMTIIINEEKCAAIDVKKAIAKVGHDTDEIKATEEDYNNLHGCCVYNRK